MDGMGNPTHKKLVEVSRHSAQPTNPRSLKKMQAFSFDSLVVEVPGIEPGSSSTKTGLLRA